MKTNQIVDAMARLLNFVEDNLIGVLVVTVVLALVIFGWGWCKTPFKWLAKTAEAKAKTAVVLLIHIAVLVIAQSDKVLGHTNTFLVTIIYLMLLVLMGINGRIFIQIPQNYVGGVFRSGIRHFYVVGNTDDLRKLVKVDIDGVEMWNPCIATRKYLVKVALYVPVLTDILNIRIYSFNPFTTIRPVVILKNYWKTPGEIDTWSIEHPNKVVGVKEKIALAMKSDPERLLRIDSTVVGIDTNIELRGNIQVTYVRQTNVRLYDLDAIYLTQNAHYSAFLDEAIRAAHIALFNALNYNEDEIDDNEKLLGKKNFQSMKLSGDPKNDFNIAIRAGINGSFGSIILVTAINDWELSEDSQKIVSEINDATASKHRLVAAKNDAEALAATLKENWIARVEGERSMLNMYKEAAGSNEGLVALRAMIDTIVSANSASGTATRVINNVSPGGIMGVLPTLALPDPITPTTPPTPAPEVPPTGNP